MKKRDNFEALAASFARGAEREFAGLNRDARALRDTMAGLARGLHVPVPKGGRRTTKSSRSSPSLFVRAAENSLGRFAAGGLLSGLGFSGGSFYSSAAQTMSLWMDTMTQAQRIR